MGYRSDVLIAAAFETKEFMEEVLAVYRTHPLVRACDMSAAWVLREQRPGEPFCLVLNMQDVKWYSHYEDVQAAEHMEEVLRMFAGERDTACGCTYIRIGEESDDSEYELETFNDGAGLIDTFLIDNFGIRREIYYS